MNIKKNYDNNYYKAQDQKKKMKYPPSSSKIFRKVKYTIKFKTITNEKSWPYSQPLPAYYD